ncbi:peptidylprolyl isomerase [Neisseria sp. 23W00296]|uniref:FKBP-type peptidyl-prolyl cis-trans isomerase n=1 Tax=unclassified Neisseria TaxID=2623750 RepID=UPI0002A4128A|nr:MULTISPECIES: peptidylprolyl isomerase [unclassified Neisseria]ASP16344.1 peptidylprolyl isomerase [Neisseria sp. KEM232]EKY03594.1 peptidyl-prolyl cis-trans isomerase, FKBP-type [Neisseria sp. oral taxon 020 str. F0370]
MNIEKGRRVGIFYTLTDGSGRLLDQSENGRALRYTAGAGEIIPGLDQALIGRAAGDKLTVTVAPAEGYGERDENLVREVDKAYLASVLPQMEEGMAIEADTGDGARVFYVREIDSERVTLDANHPLAGMTLHFDIEIADVSEAGKIRVDY